MPRLRISLIGLAHKALGKMLFCRFIIEHGQRDVLHMVLALCAAGRFAGGLNSRQQKRHQDADDGNHDQQLDEGKATSARWVFSNLKTSFCGALARAAVERNIGCRSAARTRNHVSSLHIVASPIRSSDDVAGHDCAILSTWQLSVAGSLLTTTS